MTERYVQCCDSKYGAQGLALYRSMEEHCGDFHMTWVCVDHDLFIALSMVDMPKCSVVPLEIIGIKILDFCRDSRTEREWFWTLASQVTTWELERQKQRVTYLDSDLWFMGIPDSLYVEMGDADAAMFDHRFPDVNGKRNPMYKRATYCVGWNSFAYTTRGRECAAWWAQMTCECCKTDMPAFPEWGIPAGRAGDQAYLEGFDKICDVKVIRNPLANWAPYNFPSADFGTPGFYDPPIFVHFHEAKFEGGRMTKRTGYPLTQAIVERIYEPYEAAVEEAAKELWG